MRYRHKIRGGSYKVLRSDATLQAGWVGRDRTLMVVYEDQLSGKVYVRPSDEFWDGRFEEIKE